MDENLLNFGTKNDFLSFINRIKFNFYFEEKKNSNKKQSFVNYKKFYSVFR